MIFLLTLSFESLFFAFKFVYDLAGDGGPGALVILVIHRRLAMSGSVRILQDDFFALALKLGD